MEPINISTLVVNGLNINFVDKSLYGVYRNLCRYQVSCVVVLQLLRYVSSMIRWTKCKLILFMPKKWKFNEILGTQTYDIIILCCKIVKSQIDLN